TSRRRPIASRRPCSISSVACARACSVSIPSSASSCASRPRARVAMRSSANGCRPGAARPGERLSFGGASGARTSSPIRAWRSRNFAEAIAEISRIVAHSDDFEHVAAAIADRARDLFKARAATVCRLDRTTGALTGVATSNADLGDGTTRPLVYAPGTGLSSVALREGRSLVTLDLLSDSRVSYTPELRDRVVRNNHGAMMAIPLIVYGRPVGTLGVLDGPGRVFAAD